MAQGFGQWVDSITENADEGTGGLVSARPVAGLASWVCPTADHVVASIGSLGDRA